jgi:GDP-L-fucose synthase
MDVTRIKSLGWAPEVGLEDGVRLTYDWYLENKA